MFPSNAPATWLWDTGREDEAAAVQAYWPVLRDNVLVAGNSVHATRRFVARHARRIGQQARDLERAADEAPPA